MTLRSSKTADLAFFASLGDSPGWVLSETLFRSQFLNRSFPETSTYFGTVADGAARLLRKVFGDFLFLETVDSELWLSGVLATGKYRRLNDELAELRSTARFNPVAMKRFTGNILRFFYSVRLETKNEAILSGLLDEFGEVRSGRERLEELFLLLEDYRTYQRESRCFDSAGILECLHEQLLHKTSVGANKSAGRMCGDYLVLDQLTEVSPIEREIWTLLGQTERVIVLVPEHFVLDEGKKPAAKTPRQIISELTESLPRSKKSSASAIYLANYSGLEREVLPPVAPSRIPMISVLMDSPFEAASATDDAKSLPGVETRRTAELRDEVKQAAEAIAHSLELGKFSAADVHVVLFDFPLYEELVMHELDACGVPAWVPRGRRFTETPAGSFLLSYIAWLIRPSFESFRSVASHPFRKKGSEDFFELERVVGLLGLSGELETSSQWRKPVERYVSMRAPEKLAGVSAALDAVERDLVLREALNTAADVNEIGTKIMRAFRVRRSRLTKTEGAGAREVSYSAAALRRIRKIILQAKKSAALSAGEYSVFELFGLNLRECAAEEFCYAPRPENSVSITELLDVRAMKGGVNVVLGMNAETFPPATSRSLGTDLDEMSFRLRTAAGKSSPADEAAALMTHLLLESAQLVVSYSRRSHKNEFGPARLFEQIDARSESAEILPAAEKEETLRVSPSVKRRSELIAARRVHALSPFDGNIGSVTTEAERLTALGGSDAADGKSRYSVSALETFADCPHRFFFRHLLGLEDLGQALGGEIAVEVGNAVHRSLENFFKPGSPARDLVRNDFPTACREMKKLAGAELDKSSIDWESHPALRNARNQVLMGLDSGSDDVRRGYLKAALVFQRDLFQTLPQRVEYRFGRGQGGPALSLERDGREILISGTIDRVDSEAGKPGEPVESVWDYKTGRASGISDVDSGGSLQVPLYALAVEKNFPPGTLPKRGGLISLGTPNRRDEDVPDPKKGVLVEHLAIPKKEIADPVRFRADAAAERALGLDSLFRQGEFHQILETEGCDWCSYRRSCFRNGSLLEQKLGDYAPIDSPELPVEPAKEAAGAVKKPVQLSPEQLEAALSDGRIALRAGAGSGKTQVMCTRIVELLLRGNSITSIAAITFTEKAGGELRERLERLLFGALESRRWNDTPLTDLQVNLLKRACEELPCAQIGTIHSFAASLVGMDPVLAGLTGFAGILHGGARADLLRRSVNDVINREGRELALQLLSSGIKYKALCNEAFALAGRPRELAEVRRRSLDSERGKTIAKLEQIKQKTQAELCTVVEAFLRSWEKEFTGWLETAELKDTQRPYFLELGKLAAALRSKCKEAPATEIWELFQTLLGYAEENSSQQKIVSKKNPKNYWKDLRDALRKIDASFAIYFSDASREGEGLELTKLFCELVQLTRMRYEAEKGREGMVDFDDLVAGAHRMLCAPAESLRARSALFRQRISQTFNHLLVDEFQDTDPLQWELIREIVSQTDQNNIEKTLLLVGDAQQAIYGFRGGELTVFRAAEEEVSNHPAGKLLCLKNNYRSHPKVLHFLNSLFDPLFGLDWDADGKSRSASAIRFQELLAVRAAEEAENRVLAVHQPRGGAEAVEEADGVATFIRGVLLEPDRWPALRQYRGEPKIAVLTRKSAEISLIAQALDGLKVPFSISHSSGFYDLEEIVQFENLFTVLANPCEEVALVGLLRSAIGGFHDGDLLKLRLQLKNGWSGFLTADSLAAPYDEFRERLNGWLRAAAILKTSQLAELVCRELDLGGAYRAAGDSEAFRNIERFIDALRMAEKNEGVGGSLPEARRWLREQRFDTSLAPNANDSSSPVVLMTIHGAKGLEFPMVIIPFLQSRKPKAFDFVIGETGLAELPGKFLSIQVEDEGNDYRRKKTFLQHLLEEGEKARRAAEERRLFYVACTRAREHLVLFVRENKTFLKAQADLQKMTLAERREKSFGSELPFSWLSGLMDLDSVEDPLHWVLESGFRLPIQRAK